MKTIRQLRFSIKIRPENINIFLRSLMKPDNYTLDFDVFLPSLNKNLQRGLCWDIHQKRGIIWSMLYRRYIPPICVIEQDQHHFEIIDGKQRLNAMISFINNKYTLLIEGKEYFYNELPDDYKQVIYSHPLLINIAYGSEYNEITDQDKIDWFKMINFSGTPQEIEHMNNLESKEND